MRDPPYRKGSGFHDPPHFVGHTLKTPHFIHMKFGDPPYKRMSKFGDPPIPPPVVNMSLTQKNVCGWVKFHHLDEYNYKL